MDDDETVPLALPPRRERPPSTKDLSDVQALLDATESPLRGKRVMVPLTSQAFLDGSLLPSTYTRTAMAPDNLCTKLDREDAPQSSGNGREETITEELVLASLGQGYLAEMPRAQAANLIKRRIDALVEETAPDSRKQPESERGGGTQSNAHDGNKVITRFQQSAQPDPTVLPFFEIREEYDSQGQKISAEVVSVAEHMKALKDAIKSSRENGKGDRETNAAKQEGIHELLETLDIDEFDGGISQIEVGQTKNIAEPLNEDHQQSTAISDEKFKAVSARLDELARLEEEAERSKNVNKQSSRRLHGKGWGKGFLAGDAGSEKKQVAAKPEHIDATKRSRRHDPVVGDTTMSEKKAPKKGWAKGFLNASTGKKTTTPLGKKTSAMPPSTPISGVSLDKQREPEHRKQVAFHDENEVREIPRIGQTSISSTFGAQRAAPRSNRYVDPEPSETTMFNGVVKERPAFSKVEDKQRPNRHINQQTAQPNKKLSRFAQQRLQQKG